MDVNEAGTKFATFFCEVETADDAKTAVVPYRGITGSGITLIAIDQNEQRGPLDRHLSGLARRGTVPLAPY